MDKDNILLIGSASFLASSFLNFPKYGFSKTFYKKEIDSGYYFDASCMNISTVISTIKTKPDAAIILYGITSIDKCADDEKFSRLINVTSIIKIINYLFDKDILPVFISSDAVFDGFSSMYEESADCNPIVTYGKQKREVELFLESQGKPYLNIRLPKLLSSKPDNRCIITGWLNYIIQQKHILCSVDQYFTPIDINDAAISILKLIEKGSSGTFHVAGSLRLSRKDLLFKLTKEFGKYSKINIQHSDCFLNDLPLIEKRPLDTSLNISKFQKEVTLNIKTIDEIINEVCWEFFEKRK